MKKLKLFRQTLLVIFLFIGHYTFAQNLTLHDILKIYTLDSSSLNQFLIEKKFCKTKITENRGYGYTYTFQSSEDKNISFIKTFPKDTLEKVHLYYYFDRDKEYRILKKLILNRGFFLKENRDMIKNNPKYHDYWERFTNDTFECILSSKNFGSVPHVLFFNLK